MTQEVLVVKSTEQLIVQEVGGQTVTEQVVTQEVLSVAEQGPPGPPGLPGASGTGQTTVNAAVAVGGHRAVVLTTGGAIHADNATLSHAGRVSGVTLSAAGAGGSTTIQNMGRITEPSWTWAAGNDIWLGTGGVMTQTYPTSAVFVQRLGYAISATEMWVEIEQPVIH